MALIYNATFEKNTRKLSFEDRAGNEIYSCTIPERTPAVDDITKPLTFRATQDGSTVKLVEYNNSGGSFYVSFKTSRDGGNTWEDYTEGTAITLNIGDEVSFRSSFDRNSKEFYQSYNKYVYFEMSGKIEAWHNVMSLYRPHDFATYDYIVEPYAFNAMFRGCTSLTKAPALPPTSLRDNCYYAMFSGCTSLTEAPDLPATSLRESCYRSMFAGCTSLRKTPELTATTLDKLCYGGMFNGCTSLNEVHCQMPSSYSASDIQLYTGSTYAEWWLSNVSETGTFYTNADAHWPSGASGIPNGWNRVNAYT